MAADEVQDFILRCEAKVAAFDEGRLYEVLEVAQTASAAELKKSYKRLALQYHPDKHHQNDGNVKEAASDAFKSINCAFATLSDDEKKDAFDKEQAAADNNPGGAANSFKRTREEFPFAAAVAQFLNVFGEVYDDKRALMDPNKMRGNVSRSLVAGLLVGVIAFVCFYVGNFEILVALASAFAAGGIGTLGNFLAPPLIEMWSQCDNQEKALLLENFEQVLLASGAFDIEQADADVPDN